jgi:hypothetical protein
VRGDYKGQNLYEKDISMEHRRPRLCAFFMLCCVPEKMKTFGKRYIFMAILALFREEGQGKERGGKEKREFS